MKIYTKAGDRGETGLLGGERVWKDTPRLEVCGSLDELNALLGLVGAEHALPAEIGDLLTRIQNMLFNAGSQVAAVPPAAAKALLIGESNIEQLESAIDRFETELPPLAHFILPGGCRAAALLHVARTVCRRAERRLVTLSNAEPGGVDRRLLMFLNRLSDLLFVLARLANHRAGLADVPWRQDAGG
jgi:cob(I)alamin adenosyltransferase